MKRIPAFSKLSGSIFSVIIWREKRQVQVCDSRKRLSRVCTCSLFSLYSFKKSTGDVNFWVIYSYVFGLIQRAIYSCICVCPLTQIRKLESSLLYHNGKEKLGGKEKQSMTCTKTVRKPNSSNFHNTSTED